jgi:FkbM family methyltransferase
VGLNHQSISMIRFVKKIVTYCFAKLGYKIGKIRTIAPVAQQGQLIDSILKFANLNPLRFQVLGDMVVIDNDIKIRVKTKEELAIIEEVFVNKIYSIQTNKKTTVVDIGMNVGIASLFFAQQKNVSAVFSFEPFKTTFSDALYNFQLNDRIATKIIPHQFGLSHQSEEVLTSFSADYKGMNSSMRSKEALEALAGKVLDNIEEIKIDLKKSSDILVEIINSKTEFLVAKIDCEGAEYDILNDLESSNLLKHFDAFFIEWHHKGAQLIADTLVRNNFTVLDTVPFTSECGMVYAFKSSV